MYQLTSVTPTVCDLMGISAPALSTSLAYRKAVCLANEKAGSQAIEKCLIYAPDALGTHLIEQFSEEFDPVLQYAPLKIQVHSIRPAFTPICFASMFTGALPEGHGIQKF